MRDEEDTVQLTDELAIANASVVAELDAIDRREPRRGDLPSDSRLGLDMGMDVITWLGICMKQPIPKGYAARIAWVEKSDKTWRAVVAALLERYEGDYLRRAFYDLFGYVPTLEYVSRLQADPTLPW